MYSKSAITALFLAAGLVQASPLAQPEPESDYVFIGLDKRATIDCGEGYRFLTAAQNKGYDDAIAHLNAGTTVTGSNNSEFLVNFETLKSPQKELTRLPEAYPEYYGDSPAVNGIPASCKTNYHDLRIYPVYVQETTTFTAGSNPGQERVVISRHTDGTRERCGIISHRGQASGQFKFCGI